MYSSERYVSKLSLHIQRQTPASTWQGSFPDIFRLTRNDPHPIDLDARNSFSPRLGPIFRIIGGGVGRCARS